MSEAPHRDEKEEEKEEEKRQEKSEKEGQTWEEKWRRDPVGSVAFALILIWAGLVFLAANLGMLRGLIPAPLLFLEDVPVLSAWPFVFLGAGVIVLLGVVVRLLIPAYRRAIGGDLILGLVFIAIGLGAWFGWEYIGPAALIGIGLAIVLGGVLRKK